MLALQLALREEPRPVGQPVLGEARILLGPGGRNGIVTEESRTAGPGTCAAADSGCEAAGRAGEASGAGELMTLVVRELGGGARPQRASIALLLERALSISVAQRPTLSVAGDRQLPSVQLGLAAELEARR